MITAVILRSLSIAALVYRAYKHKSLSPSGITVAVITAIIHSIHPWSINLILLFAFYLAGTKATKYNYQIKSGFTVTEGNQGEGVETRNHIQVIANSGIASILIILHLITQRDELMYGVIANYAAVTADTLSSELGILSQTQPFLIINLKPCPKGTNGGVSKLGFVVAAIGGLYIGVLSVLFSPLFNDFSIFYKIAMIFVTGFLGLYGSVLDSVLGATLQRSTINKQGKIIESAGGYKLKSTAGTKALAGKDLLSNNQVNLLMALVTSIFGIVLYTVIN